MSNKWLIVCGLLGMLLLLNVTGGTTAYADMPTGGGYDLNKIKTTSEQVSIDSMGAMAKEYSIPIIVIVVVLSGFMALGGLVFKPLKLAAGSLLGIGILFFVLVNYAPEVAGIMISFVDNIMTRLTGGA
ncbi:hypothetical protein [Bacillus sp. 1P06AnD]|uniref:hypothetical protein n=1 Tax=Bacillus sp. 1P06AnD TaxID=3132208 RepID=UPI0039A01CA5